MKHMLRLERPAAEAVLSGDKNFIICPNDEEYQKGDIISFRVDFFQPKDETPIEKIPFLITHVVSGFGLKENYIAFGIKRI